MLMRDNTNSTKKKWISSWWFRSLITVVPAVAIALGISLFLNRSTHAPSEPVAGGTSVSGENTPDVPERDPNAGEYVEPKKDNAAQKGISIPGWNSISIPRNKKEVTVDLYNPEANEGQYHLTFELRLPDDSEQGYEVLYKSGLVDPGLHIQNITLSRELDAGVYDAMIHVQPYRMDEQKTATNNADMQTKLIVE